MSETHALALKHVWTHSTTSSTVGQPITGAACGGGEQAEQEEVGRDEKCCRRRREVWGLKEADAHQLLMLNSESDHCLSAGFEQPARLSRTSPYPSFCFPLFDGHTFPSDSICFPCRCARQTRSPLMEVPLSVLLAIPVYCSTPLLVSHLRLRMPHTHSNPYNAVPLFICPCSAFFFLTFS